MLIHKKVYFPIYYQTINYSGEYPDYKYFSKITLNDYQTYKNEFGNNVWSFRTESINYCNQDCITLYQIMIKFNRMIYNLYKLNINNYPTLSSLSFAIFRCKYLKEDTVCTISGQVYNDIRLSYTGGAVEMYIPTNESNELVYGYDVNASYFTNTY